MGLDCGNGFCRGRGGNRDVRRAGGFSLSGRLNLHVVQCSGDEQLCRGDECNEVSWSHDRINRNSGAGIFFRSECVYYFVYAAAT